MPAVNGVGKPCAGEPHARFDGRELETEQRSGQGHEVKDPRENPAVTGGFETYRRSSSPRQLSTLPTSSTCGSSGGGNGSRTATWSLCGSPTYSDVGISRLLGYAVNRSTL